MRKCSQITQTTEEEQQVFAVVAAQHTITTKADA